MRRTFILMLALLALGLLAAPVLANNGNGRGNGNGNGSGTVWNKKKCEDAGGVWVNERGVKSCYMITEEEYDGPDVFEGIPDPVIQDFLDRSLEEGDIIELVAVYSQRGNVGAPGTADTLASSFFCKKLGVADLFPDSVCDFLQREYGVDRNPLDL